jgi:predicted metal-binding membrane protein
MTRAARERWRIQAPMLAVCAIAWMLILARLGGSGAHEADGGAMMQGPTWDGAAAMFGSWMLMMMAMMSPLLLAPVRHVHNRSFSRRRGRAVVLFLSGYSAVWMVVGFALVIDLGASGWAVVVAGLVAVVWQVSPLKQRCLNRCHAHRELAAFGVAADVDAVRFGLQHGMWCAGSCWALMLLPMLLSSGHVAAMAVAGAWLFAERLERPATPRWSWRVPLKAVRIVLGQAKMASSMYWLRNLPSGS